MTTYATAPLCETSVREAVVGDEANVIELLTSITAREELTVAAFELAMSKNVDKRFYPGATHYVFVAERGGEFAGCAHVIMNVRATTSLELITIGVQNSHRMYGILEELLLALERFGRDYGASELILLQSKTPTSASERAFFATIGIATACRKLMLAEDEGLVRYYQLVKRL